MSGTTISTAITVGVTLTAASQNPVLVTRTGSIYSTDGYNALSLGAGVDWSVTNLGSITGNGYATELGTAVSGIDFLGSGSVTNGSATDTTADITGSYGILFENSAGTVTNFGTIGNPTPESTNFAAVMFEQGGTVINGSLVDKSAAIEAGINGATLVENFGSMTMFSDYSGGVFVTTGTVLNGSVTDTTASIFATTYGAAVTVYGNGNMASGGPSSSITNFGSILNYQGDGVEAGSGVTLINGSDSDRTAQIDTGSYLGDAVELQGTNATVKNFGKITVDLGNSADAIFVGGVSSGYGAVATATIVNGDSLDTTALISGREAGIAGPTSPGEPPAVITVVNFGTIEGAIGIDLAHLSLFNVSSTGVITNAGTIASTDGAGGVAIQFGEGAERLIVDPGAVFVGSVIGGTGENVLELAAGTGTIGGLATTDDASAQFQGFDKTVVDASGTWSLTGNNTMGLLVDNGALTLQAGTTLDVQSMLTGTSGITMTAGDTIEVAAAAAQSPSITFLTGDALVLPYAQGFGTGTGTSAYAGPLLQDFAHSDAIDLLNFAPTSITGLAYDPASGLLQVQQGSKTVADLTFKLDGSLGANAFQFGTDGRSVPGTLITLR